LARRPSYVVFQVVHVVSVHYNNGGYYIKFCQYKPKCYPEFCDVTRATGAPRHPQQNGNNAQIAAAAWFGLKNPNPILTKSPATNSILYAF